MYSHISVTHSTMCDSQSDLRLQGNEGVISSHVTDETGCGSTRSPWVIDAMPGQTIELSIIDFGSEKFKMEANMTSEYPVYGVIQDGSDRKSFNGNPERERIIHTSQSDHLIIEITPATERGENNFLLQYKSKSYHITE